MIPQASSGLNSRSDANIHTEDDYLPLITAPMSTVINPSMYRKFYDNHIKICLPRMPFVLPEDDIPVEVFRSYDLATFRKIYVDERRPEDVYICIDVANGNMPALHETIQDATRFHGGAISIMSGNVSSPNAFKQLERSGCDYIRVGIGGGSACTTTVHTGVGHENLERLIGQCYLLKNNSTHIVADGISSFISDQNLHRNGYAAIIRLLAAGASYVMLGAIFNKAMESAGKKVNIAGGDGLSAIYRGMSTKEEQQIYRVDGDIRHSEGRTIYNKVEYTIKEWLHGSESMPDEFPGFRNALASAMAYTGHYTLKSFIGHNAENIVAKNRQH